MNSTIAPVRSPTDAIRRPISPRRRLPRVRFRRPQMPDWRGFLRRHRHRIENILMLLGFVAVVALSVVLIAAGDS